MSAITTHVLDTSTGRPAAGVRITLERADPGGLFRIVGGGTTDRDGRCRELLPENATHEAGTFRLRFETAAYYATMNTTSFFPVVEITFSVRDAAQHYHVPLLLSPFGYSTYRGS